MSGLSRLVLKPVKRLPLLMAQRLAGRHLPLHAPDFPLVLLFNEKAGCTSLTKWFLFHVGKLDEATRFHPWVHRYRTKVLCRQPGYRWQALRALVLPAKPIVKLVRNPYDRAVSSFLSTLNNAHGANGKRWARELVAAARAHAGKPAADMPALSFRDFLRFLAANGTERGLLNGHVARQHVRGEERRIDRIIKLERFGEEIRQIESAYKLAQSPPDLITFSRHHRSAVHSGAVALASRPDLEITSEQVRQGAIPAYDTLYDEETRRLVRQCFAADFEAYGYEK
ncbi:MAG TPA: sulfotransferase family 2 domain-containing protein [Aestuariivirgaceae bacterium]|nr:sulfotransferase family 2 domain-containing protein [Aestuariivirgaceae bacterium]